MDRCTTLFEGRVLRALTAISGVAAVLFLGLAATSYRFDWSLGGAMAVGSMPRPSWGCGATSGYILVSRISERLIADVGDEGTFVLSVSPVIERSFCRLFRSSFGKEIWVTGNIYDPEARHEFQHCTVWASLWYLGSVCAVLPVVQSCRALRRWRAERMRDRCAKCRYWLVGNQSGICPECGTPIPVAQRERLSVSPVGTG